MRACGPGRGGGPKRESSILYEFGVELAAGPRFVRFPRVFTGEYGSKETTARNGKVESFVFKTSKTCLSFLRRKNTVCYRLFSDLLFPKKPKRASRFTVKKCQSVLTALFVAAVSALMGVHTAEETDRPCGPYLICYLSSAHK